MSDDDFMFEGDEDYEFEFEDDGNEEEDLNVDAENNYYNAKAMREENPKRAKDMFLEIVNESSGDLDEWAFRALKQAIKLCFAADKQEEMLRLYQQLLGSINSTHLTRNYTEKCINNILEYASNSKNAKFLDEFYKATLKTLEKQQNNRLWLKTNMKYAEFFLKQKNFHKFKAIVKQLHKLLDNEEGVDQNRGAHILELYSLEIQFYTEVQDTKHLKEIYDKSLRVRSAIPHPRILGIVRECGGKMHMLERKWKEAQTEFFEAFKCYDEAGSLARIQVLKYLVLASMLSESKINPFDSPETLSYKNNPEIISMTELVDAYERYDVKAVERVLEKHHDDIMNDTFISQYVGKIISTIRSHVLFETIQPLTQVKLDFLAEYLDVSVPVVEQALVDLIVTGKINGRIDAINNVFTSAKVEDTDDLENRLIESTQKVWEKLTRMEKQEA
ncbi:COP9/signalosome complex subunit Csn2 [Schizosaccharomyces japonicus yFS275]|uniref:COP9 signalosome complex subunit 2 n=1 Tax=Schizosaccharomyces japonicus (strain yFS275 / FY16936) TaxID=402676 RepID=B6K3X9_SCHJY|nr:COP9/signalosome complex subunit Csn2 [Schizosaccharomyces japonicus yFS275]EEB08186.1 COP9/signalosome complex subunit Csn2 [Schizosaccharomyces japonicus yFS275]